MHPAKEGFSALPFFDEFDLSTVDILLISQYVYSFATEHQLWGPW
jgi:cleavage and polyadenylation specificity factor subunit 3